MLYYYQDKKMNDYLRDKAKSSLKKIIDNCDNLSALEPLLHVSPDKILKHILNQYIKYLKINNTEFKNFIQNGGLQKLQELKFSDTVKNSPIGAKLVELINTINSYYPAEIVKYYTPEGMSDDMLVFNNQEAGDEESVGDENDNPEMFENDKALEQNNEAEDTTKK